MTIKVAGKEFETVEQLKNSYNNIACDLVTEKNRCEEITRGFNALVTENKKLHDDLKRLKQVSKEYLIELLKDI